MLVEKYKCDHCGHIYIYMEYDNGNKMNVPFEELEKNWVCPVCGLSKDIFKKIESE